MAPPPSDCPFCAIASLSPPSHSLLPSSPSPPTPSLSSTSTNSPPAHLLLSTRHTLALLDHAPIAQGHTLLIVRSHREKSGDLTVEEGEECGRWLGVLGRAVVGGVVGEEVEREEGDGDIGRDGFVEGGRGKGEGEEDVGDWNVVQNNGARAAQVVPHVHYHIIPRVGSEVPEVKARSWTVFGKGQREDLDEDDARVLVRRIRRRLVREVERARVREGEGAVRRLFGEEGMEKGEGWREGSKL
ncbi:hypothetical protein ACLMJK_003960 [Lecanora helva]